MASEHKPHSGLEPAALVELATAVGQWLGAESAPDDVIRTQERVVEWAQRLVEQLEAVTEHRDGLKETIDFLWQYPEVRKLWPSVSIPASDYEQASADTFGADSSPAKRLDNET